MIGKHYLVKSTSHPKSSLFPSLNGEFDERKPGTKRHYTEAFCMRKNVFELLMKLAKND